MILSHGNRKHSEGRQIDALLEEQVRRARSVIDGRLSSYKEANRGRPKQSYQSTLIRDVGTKTKEELRTLRRDRDLWRRISAIDRT